MGWINRRMDGLDWIGLCWIVVWCCSGGSFKRVRSIDSRMTFGDPLTSSAEPQNDQSSVHCSFHPCHVYNNYYSALVLLSKRVCVGNFGPWPQEVRSTTIPFCIFCWPAKNRVVVVSLGISIMSSSSSTDLVESSSWWMDTVTMIVWRLGTVVLGLVSILGGLLYVKQDNLLYFPEIGGIPRRPEQNPQGYRSPAERNLPFEECDIVCKDGVHIHAWLLVAQQVQQSQQSLSSKGVPTILFFHGNAGNIGLRIPNMLELHRSCAPVNILMVEYRGYGNSDSVTPNEHGLRLDAQAAYHYCLQHDKIDSTLLYAFGRSLGGAVAISLADYAQRHSQHDPPLAGVMVENTFTSVSAMVDKLMPFLTPIKPIVLRIGWDSTKLVPALTLPILFLAGDSDELVPHQHMKDLLALSTASVLVQMHIIKGGTHNESWWKGGTLYWEAIRNFLVKTSQRPLPGARPFGNALGTAAITSSGAVVPEQQPGQSSIPIMSSNLVGMARDAAALTKKKEADDKQKNV